ncbi:DNA-directed RNA polymerase subunit beta [Capsicum annuum]|nr:DNA-directed RNA polymerase subunit beta [Capsicum annuum]
MGTGSSSKYFSFSIFSIGASLIPFIKHNDANRALMISKMQCQAVSLSRSEKCIVGTGLEQQAALDSGALAIAEREGRVIYTNTNTILLAADGTAMVGGELALGKNVLVAFIPWEGYNSEDAVLISERLVYEDIYTFFHIWKYEIQTHLASQGPEEVTNEIPHLEAHLLRNLDKNGIMMLGSWVETGDILVGKLIPQVMKESSYAPEDRLLRAILGIQIFECSLGLAGSLLDRHYRIAPFEERYEQEASRKLVFSELYEASKQTWNPWVFEPKYPGKSRIFDGRTGNPFEQPVIIGKPYILKLIHQVDDKIHGHSSGHYVLVTQQPLSGRAKQGGQRVGEMEVWALEGFGVAHILQEMLTYKSNHIRAHQEVLGTKIIGGTIPNPEDNLESFRLLVRELRSLDLELNHFLVSEKNFQINRKEA